jgi:hypothetical protein
LALGTYRLRVASRFMTAVGVRRTMARRIAWGTAMATAAYGAEVTWEDQGWFRKGFEDLTAKIGREVAGTFGTAKGTDTVRAAGIAPAGPALDRRRARFLVSAATAQQGTPRAGLLPPPGDRGFRAADHQVVRRSGKGPVEGRAG